MSLQNPLPPSSPNRGERTLEDDTSDAFKPEGNVVGNLVVSDTQIVSADDADLDAMETKNQKLRQQVVAMQHLPVTKAKVAEPPSYDALSTPGEGEDSIQQRRKMRRCIAGFIALGVIIVAVASGIVVASSNSEDTASSSPTFDDNDTASPPPTPVVSERCTNAPPDLAALVDAYLADPSPTNIVAVTYGWPIGAWCVAGHTDFSRLFSTFRNWAAADFNEDLSGWDVADARDMTDMFFGTKAFQGNLSSWNVSQVTTMEGMFEGSTFNGDISGWDVSRVTNMRGMFVANPVFNRDLSRWQTTSLVRMDSMFAYTTSFNADISGWDVSKVIDFRWAFQNATGFSQNLCEWGFEAESSNTTSMFLGSGCPEQGDPDLSRTPLGPLCVQC